MLVITLSDWTRSEGAPSAALDQTPVGVHTEGWAVGGTLERTSCTASTQHGTRRSSILWRMGR
jgi:hypothetical protein